MPKLLIVEDNKNMRELLRLSLTHIACQIQEAENGEDALKIAAEWVPDIVLLDIMMPGNMDGFRLFPTSWIRPTNSATDSFVC